ncbi:hypothetical protein [Streptomyces sp. NPDC048172]|uniref:hypothetical protein n=1 Tax=Streptomyces sp. NPDC048172 TaxID=3365505 RepID=UPI0037234DA3
MTIWNGDWVNSHRGIRPLALLVCASVLGLTGCGEDAPDREYAIPEKLCGVPVKAKLLEPFLPDGKETSQKEQRNADDVEGLSCDLLVDGKTAIALESEWHAKKPSLRDVNGSSLITDPSPPERPAALRGGSYVVGDRVAAAAVPCHSTEARRTDPAEGFTFSVELFDGPGSDKESKKALQRFMGPFSEALVKKLPCRGA